jgi:hypothetical protein
VRHDCENREFVPATEGGVGDSWAEGNSSLGAALPRTAHVSDPARIGMIGALNASSW